MGIMSNFSSDSPLDHLIRKMSRLPGLGPRSAKRMALHLLTNKDNVMEPLIQSLKTTYDSMKTCAICGNLDTQDPCRICSDTRRDPKTLCIVAQVADLWAIERSGSYRGQYHVLGGILSALDGITPDDLNIPSLLQRVREDGVEEVILALSATVDGQSTAHYLSDHLEPLNVNVTRLAHGVPVGGELDYLDDGTISTALKSRARV